MAGIPLWGFAFVPTVLLAITVDQLFDIMSILLRERMTSCRLSLFTRGLFKQKQSQQLDI